MESTKSYYWKVRYVKNGESKMRSFFLETNNECMEELFEELSQNDLDDARIVSIRNETFKNERENK